MESRPVSQNRWLIIYLLVASLVILLLSIGNWLLFSHTWTDETIGIAAEEALILAGVFVVLPVGLLNLWLAASAWRSKRTGLTAAAAISGLLTGALGLVTGLVWYGSLAFLLAGGFR